MESHIISSNAVFRENRETNKNTMEASYHPTTASVRRPNRQATTVATAEVQRRRVIKKHIQQKYLLCGFAIHAFLSTPVYLYGNVVESDKELVLRIWPTLAHLATHQLSNLILTNLNTEYRGSSRETMQCRRLFLSATLLTCISLMISGFFFSSAWITVTTTTQTIAIVFYGFFAGIGSSIFIWKTHVILEAVRPREDRFVRKTIHLCGEAFCQLFLSFVFTSLRTLYGTAQSIILMSALLVNLIPISLIITRHREGAITKRISVIKAESNFPPLHHQLGRLTSSFVDQVDGIELQLQRPWKNQLMEHSPTTALLVESHSNYVLPADEAYVTFVNPNGVEIMEIIMEEDETVSVTRSSSATIENCGRASVSASQTMNQVSTSNGLQQQTEDNSNLVKIQEFSRNITAQISAGSDVLKDIFSKVIVPLQKAIVMPKLYSTSFLLSADIFSYVMCLTVLPGLAISHHALKNAEIPFLFSLLAFPWMCFSLMTPRFGNSLYKRKFQWHILGCICKGIALIFISFSTSKLLLSVSSVFLGFGQAVSLFLQDSVLQMSMPRSQWLAIHTPLYLTNGILVLIYGCMAHWIVVHFTFQATVLLAGCLYTSSVAVWLSIYIYDYKK